MTEFDALAKKLRGVAKSYKKKMKLRKKEKKEKKSQTRIEIFDELQVKHDVHQMLHDVHAMLKTNGTLLQSQQISGILRSLEALPPLHAAAADLLQLILSHRSRRPLLLPMLFASARLVAAMRPPPPTLLSILAPRLVSRLSSENVTISPRELMRTAVLFQSRGKSHSKLFLLLEQQSLSLGLSAFSPRLFMRLVFAMAEGKQGSPTFWASVRDRARKMAVEGEGADDVARFAWALGVRGILEAEPLWRMEAKLKEAETVKRLSTQAWAKLLWLVASSRKVSPALVVSSLLPATLGGAKFSSKLSAEELVSAAWSLQQVLERKQRSEKMQECAKILRAEVLSRPPASCGWSEQQLFSLTRSMANLKVLDLDSLQHLYSCLLSAQHREEKMNLKQMQDLMQEVAKLSLPLCPGGPVQALFNHLTAKVLARPSNEFGFRYLTPMLWSCAKCQVLSRELVEAVNDRFRRKEVPMPKPSVMATIAWSLSRSEFLLFASEAFNFIAQSITSAQLLHCTSQDVANLVWALARSSLVPPTHRFWRDVEQHLQGDLSRFNVQELANLAMAGAILVCGGATPLAWGGVLRCSLARVEQLGEREAAQVAMLHLASLPDGGSELSLPPSLASRMPGIQGRTRSSALHYEVEEKLRLVPLAFRCEVPVLSGLYVVDLVVDMDGTRIALEVDGPSHFLLCPPEAATSDALLLHGDLWVPTAATRLKRYLLKKEGFVLVSVPSMEWETDLVRSNATCWLKEKLEAAVRASRQGQVQRQQKELGQQVGGKKRKQV